MAADWPTEDVPTTNFESEERSPRAMRLDLRGLIEKFNRIRQALGQAGGVCDLDSNGRVPFARLATGTGAEQVAAGGHTHDDRYPRATQVATISATWTWSAKQKFPGWIRVGDSGEARYPADIIGTAACGYQIVNPDAVGGAWVEMRAEAGFRAGLMLKTGELERWRFVKSLHTEAGANAGSDIVLDRYADDGTIIETAWRVWRANGAGSWTGDWAVGGRLSGGDLLVGNGTVPTTSTSPGVAGQMAFDTNYLYRCVATNTWRRWAGSTF
jgi:hypothetical protein